MATTTQFEKSILAAACVSEFGPLVAINSVAPGTLMSCDDFLAFAIDDKRWDYLREDIVSSLEQFTTTAGTSRFRTLLSGIPRSAWEKIARSLSNVERVKIARVAIDVASGGSGAGARALDEPLSVLWTKIPPGSYSVTGSGTPIIRWPEPDANGYDFTHYSSSNKARLLDYDDRNGSSGSGCKVHVIGLTNTQCDALVNTSSQDHKTRLTLALSFTKPQGAAAGAGMGATVATGARLCSDKVEWKDLPPGSLCVTNWVSTVRWVTARAGLDFSHRSAKPEHKHSAWIGRNSPCTLVVVGLTDEQCDSIARHETHDARVAQAKSFVASAQVPRVEVVERDLSAKIAEVRAGLLSPTDTGSVEKNRAVAAILDPTTTIERIACFYLSSVGMTSYNYGDKLWTGCDGWPGLKSSQETLGARFIDGEFEKRLDRLLAATTERRMAAHLYNYRGMLRRIRTWRDGFPSDEVDMSTLLASGQPHVWLSLIGPSNDEIQLYFSKRLKIEGLQKRSAFDDNSMYVGSTLAKIAKQLRPLSCDHDSVPDWLHETVITKPLSDQASRTAGALGAFVRRALAPGSDSTVIRVLDVMTPGCLLAPTSIRRFGTDACGLNVLIETMDVRPSHLLARSVAANILQPCRAWSGVRSVVISHVGESSAIYEHIDTPGA